MARFERLVQKVVTLVVRSAAGGFVLSWVGFANRGCECDCSSAVAGRTSTGASMRKPLGEKRGLLVKMVSMSTTRISDAAAIFHATASIHCEYTMNLMFRSPLLEPGMVGAIHAIFLIILPAEKELPAA